MKNNWFSAFQIRWTQALPFAAAFLFTSSALAQLGASGGQSQGAQAMLWWGDPFDGTVGMGEMPTPGDYSGGKAVVRPREDKLTLIAVCGVACHNGTFPPPPKDKNPRALTMHQDIVPDALNLQHGRGAIWCLDCHHPTTRNKLIDNFGNPISFNEPQKL